jgi:hypothetical protein
VPRSIDKREPVIVSDDLVGTDVLGDSPGFTGNDVCVTDGIQERRLAMIDMTEDRYHWRANLKVRALFLRDAPRSDGRDILHLPRDEPKYASHHGSGLEVDLLIDVREYAGTHQLLDDLHRLDLHPLSQRANSYSFT